MGAENTKTALTKKSIKAIADEVELRLKQDSIKPASAEITTPAERAGHVSKKVFFLGAASGLALAVTAPLLGKQARPAMRGAIKGGLLASRYFQRVASSVKEDVQDLTEEAKSDLDVEKQKSDSAGTPKRGTEPIQ
ncbi:MAG TPA: hypothetical protein VGM27_09000 [Acidobacteriaceae bacterium]